MNVKIGALIISAEEPQLERCLHSVYNQTVPFSNIVHMNNVIPESKAFNKGLAASTDDWIMKINGDMILYDNAVEIALSNMEENEDIFLYSYGLFDAFLQAPICECGVFLKSAFLRVRYPNMLTDDVYSQRKLRRQGFVRRTPYRDGIMVGTHCADPDEFQVFRRFYSNGVKHGKRFMGRLLQKLYKHTKDPLYDLAFKALMFGMTKRDYPTSHNLNFDKIMFDKFKKEVVNADNNYKASQPKELS